MQDSCLTRKRSFFGCEFKIQRNFSISTGQLPLIRKICRKVSKQVAVLNCSKKILPFELRIDIYHAFTAPHFNYCSESWHHCGKRGCAKLEKINEQALRFVTRDKSSMYETLLKQLNLLSPLNQRIVKMVTAVYKAIDRYKVPRGIGELLHERSTNYNHWMKKQIWNEINVGQMWSKYKICHICSHLCKAQIRHLSLRQIG